MRVPLKHLVGLGVVQTCQAPCQLEVLPFLHWLRRCSGFVWGLARLQAAAEAQQLRELEDKVESLSAQLAATTDAQHAAEASLQCAPGLLGMSQCLMPRFHGRPAYGRYAPYERVSRFPAVLDCADL